MSRLETLVIPTRQPRPAPTLDRQESDGAWPTPNVGDTERRISLLGGFALTGLGLLRGGLTGVAMAGTGALLAWRGYTGHCDIYEALDIDMAGAGEQDGADPRALYERGVKIQEAITIGRPAQDLFEHWRRFESHARFMPNVESVKEEDDGNTIWRIRGPGGTHWEYEAEVINEEPGRLIAWRSLDGSEVQHAGSVRFIDAPGGRGTEVHLNVEYLPPAGAMGRFSAKLLRLIGKAPRDDVREGLRNFKRLMETGELATTKGQPRGSRC